MRLLSIILLFLIFSGCKSQQTLQDGPEDFGEFTGSQIACGHFNLYLLDETGKSYLHIFFSENGQQLKTENHWDMNETGVLSAELKWFSTNVSRILCSDLRPREKISPVKQESASGGSISIYFSDEELVNYLARKPFRMKVVLKQVSFPGYDHELTFELDDVAAGWYPG